MGKYNSLFIVLLFALSSCSTKVFLGKPINLSGKRIAVGLIELARNEKGKTIQKDSICVCTGVTVGTTIASYLQKTGAVVIHIPYDEKTSEMRIYQIADSSQVDYLLTGTGLLHRTGKTDFMEKLNIQLVAVKTREVLMSGSFSGLGVYPEGAAERLGKKMVKKIY
jgi:hypothetical protein